MSTQYATVSYDGESSQQREMLTVIMQVLGKYEDIDYHYASIGTIGRRWFSLLDLRFGYWQVRIAKRDEHKTSVIICMSS